MGPVIIPLATTSGAVNNTDHLADLNSVSIIAFARHLEGYIFGSVQVSRNTDTHGVCEGASESAIGAAL